MKTKINFLTTLLLAVMMLPQLMGQELESPSALPYHLAQMSKVERDLYIQQRKANLAAARPNAPLPTRSSWVTGQAYFYSFSGADGNTFGNIPIEGPFTPYNTINTFDLGIAADDFGPDGILYGIDYYTNYLYSIDPATGIPSPLFEIDAIGESYISGLSYNPNDGLWYGLAASSILGTRLFTINPNTGENEILADVEDYSVPIWLVIDNDGTAYVASVITDQLLTIDLTNGSTNAIGPLGIDINYAQEADIDPATGNLYIAADTIDENPDGVYLVDKTTGEATLQYTTNGNEITMFSISNPYPDTSCTPPSFTFSYTDNTDNCTYDLSMDVTDLGSDGTFQIEYDDMSMTISGIGSYDLGTYENETEVDINVITPNELCGSTVSAYHEISGCITYNMETTVDCDTGLMNQTYCYDNYEENHWLFTSSSGQPLTLTFTAGVIEAYFYDRLFIYDGVNSTGTLLFESDIDILIEDLADLTVTATSGNLYMYFYSDNIFSCANPIDSNEFVPWEYDIVCEGETTTCDAPSSLTVDVVDNTNVTFVDNAGAEGDMYDVVSSANPGFDPMSVSPQFEGVSVPYTVPFPLANNWTYEFYARKYCGEELSDWAGPFQFTVTPGEAVIMSPNPTMSRVGVTGMDVAKVEIYNSFGRLVMSSKVIGNEFNVQHLRAGNYTVRLIDANGKVSVQQLMKQ